MTGLEHVAGKLAAHPEPAFLTFSVVVFLLFLGHHLREDLRTWMSVRKEHPEIDKQTRCAPQTARATRRVDVCDWRSHDNRGAVCDAGDC